MINTKNKNLTSIYQKYNNKKKKFKFYNSFIVFIISFLSIFLIYFYDSNLNRKIIFEKVTNLLLNDYYFQNQAKIKNIEIIGNKDLSEDKILNFLNLNVGDSMIKYSAFSIREKLELLPEIKRVEVKIEYPNKINIYIHEKRVAVIWKNSQGQFVALDDDGDVINDKLVDYKNTKHLMIFGENADKNFQLILNYLYKTNFYNKIASIYFVNNRRWNVFLYDGKIIKIPAFSEKDKILDSLNFIDKLLSYKEQIENFENVKTIDLRLFPKRVYISF